MSLELAEPAQASDRFARSVAIAPHVPALIAHRDDEIWACANICARVILWLNDYTTGTANAISP